MTASFAIFDSLLLVAGFMGGIMKKLASGAVHDTGRTPSFRFKHRNRPFPSIMSTDEQAADRLASLVVSTLLTIAGAVTVSAVAGVLKIFTTTVGAVTISFIKYSSEVVKQAIQDCADVTSHAITLSVPPIQARSS
ncbi:hypothetical protein BDZ88DRAFT_450430 [Geranomyces variabilis]|nr:hypothetical protein BDZ88DRAFT_450430 [Geranomyces variabilis]KAJ3134912.1 hypothetical protein HDU90_004237 [Geranomyces variabilis]